MDYLGVVHYSFLNASYEPSPKSMKDVDWNILALTKSYDQVIALGHFASKALTKLSVDHFCLPHPSPLNRQLNDPQYERTVLSECYNYLHHEN